MCLAGLRARGGAALTERPRAASLASAYLNAPMWAELFLWNRDCLVEEIDAFTARLQQLKGYLQAGQREELEAMFRASSAARTAFDKKEKEG